MKRLLGSRGALAVFAGLLALFVAGGGYALATGSNTISACAHKKGGGLYIGRCAKRDKKLRWNVQGPPGMTGARGLQGPQGQQGVRGIQGSPGTPGPSAAFSGSSAGVSFTGTGSVGSLNVPAGNYVVVAKTWAWDITPSTGSVLIDCTLTAGSDTDEVRAELAQLDDPGDAQSLAFNLVHTFNAEGTIDLACNVFSKTVSFSSVRITAIQVGSLTSGALGS